MNSPLRSIPGLFITCAAHASVIIAVELLRAHRSSLWAPLESGETFGAFLAWCVIAIAIALPTIVISLALHALPLARERSDGRPPIVVSAVVAIAIILGLGWQNDFDSVIELELMIGLCIATTAAQMAAWREYAGFTTLPALVSFFAALAMMAGMLTHDILGLHAESHQDTVIVAAFGGWAAVMGAALFAYSVFRASRYRDSFANIFVGAGVAAAGAYFGFIFLFNTPSAPDLWQRPNLILVTVDTLRADMLSVYKGMAPTPGLESLAEKSLVFDRAYTLAPWTLPSVFGMMASEHPPQLSPNGDYTAWSREISLYRMEQQTRTLAERLRDEGYATGACVANAFLHDRQGVLRGFDTVRVIGHRTPTLDRPLRGLPMIQRAAHRIGLPFVYERPADTTRVCEAFAQSYVRTHVNQPYFLWIHLMDPHTAYAPPDRYQPRDTEWPVYCNADPYWGTPQSDESGELDVTDAQRASMKALYQGEIRYIDEAVWSIWATLHDLPHADKSFFAITSDHGEAFFEHGKYGHGQSLYDHQVRAPLMIKGPEIEPRRIAHPVSQIDLIPTLADLLDVESDGHWQGRSWTSWLLNGDRPVTASPVFAQATNVYSADGPQVMVVRGSLKTIMNVRTGRAVTYDLENDPEEQHPISPADETAVRILNAHLDQKGRLVEEVYRQNFTSAGESEQIEKLKSFGYIH